MSIANDIISRKMPDFDKYLKSGESLDDLDEYGFTPLIETAITSQPEIAKQLINYGVDVNARDASGRTALHWAVDNHDLSLCKLLLSHGADANAYTKAGLSVLVYPLLREQTELKRLLYQHNAQVDFALDFIQAKLLGHRFELKGDVDIVNAEGEFIELDFEGFILEFTVAVIKDSLRRFTGSFSTRHLREYFPKVYQIMDAFDTAAVYLKLQHHSMLTEREIALIRQLLQQPLRIFPVASRGHAIGFVQYKQWWAKIDRGENSLKEGTVNIYRMAYPERVDERFVQEFMYKKQPQKFFHKSINTILGLEPIANIPMTAQISGNCSWANTQAMVAVAYALVDNEKSAQFFADKALYLYEAWVQWDQDRALENGIHRFYLIDKKRKASYAAMLASVLFQSCDYQNKHHLHRAEKLLSILSLPDYRYILDSYLQVYCVDHFTQRGNNLLKILDDCGINPNIGVSPIATSLNQREKK